MNCLLKQNLETILVPVTELGVHIAGATRDIGAELNNIMIKCREDRNLRNIPQHVNMPISRDTSLIWLLSSTY